MKIFSKVKELRSREGELHFTRFAILESRLFSIYIHRIYHGDKDPYLHTHPWNFFGVVLKGAYWEKYWGRKGITSRYKGFLSCGRGNREYLHQISAVEKPVTTLFITWGRKRPWSFLVDDQLVDSQEFIKNKSKYLTKI